jgi:hypothetical protein
VTKHQSTSGCSITTQCSPQARTFIVDKFGDAKSIEQLLMDIDAFICTRTYIPKSDGDKVQTFDIDVFIANDCNGLCFDWSCFTSVVVSQVAEVKGWDVTTLVVDADSTVGGVAHSFNFIIVDGETYFIDTTIDNTRYKKGVAPIGYVNIGSMSKEEFAIKKLNYKIRAYH